MANLKEVRERIKSVISTQQITKAMKMVSAAKLRRAQEGIVRFRPYATKLQAMMQNIIANMEGDSASELGQVRDVQKAFIVVVTSNKGLCGAFNTNIIKEAIKLVEGRYAEQRASGNLYMMFIGKKGYDYFKKHYADIRLMDDYVGILEKINFDEVVRIPEFLMDSYKDKDLDEAVVVYGEFKNAAVQFARAEQFLPVPKPKKVEDEEQKRSFKADYIFEPSKEKLLQTLIPTILKNQFYKYLLDTSASEHGARMTAMENATENANEMLKELKISYNKARQEAITRELSEIVSGAKALEEG